MTLINKKMFKFYMPVFAEGGEGNTEKDYEALIQKARQEEKDKLYPEIEALKNKNKTLSEELQTKTTEITDLQKKIEETTAKYTTMEEELEELKSKNEKAGEKDKELQKLQKTIGELTTKLKDIEKIAEEREKANEERVRKMNLELFKKEKLLEAGDEIILELVSGETEEEITTSIETAKAKYKEIYEKAVKGVPPTKPANPNVGIIPKDMKPEDIRKMSPEEYKEYRKALFKK